MWRRAAQQGALPRSAVQPSKGRVANNGMQNPIGALLEQSCRTWLESCTGRDGAKPAGNISRRLARAVPPNPRPESKMMRGNNAPDCGVTAPPPALSPHPPLLPSIVRDTAIHRIIQWKRRRQDSGISVGMAPKTEMQHANHCASIRRSPTSRITWPRILSHHEASLAGKTCELLPLK